MQKYSQLIKMALLSFVLLQLSACGYKPSAKYTRNITGEKISTSIVISAEDPENTVIIKDALDSAVVELFHASLTSRNHSDTHLGFSISSPTYSPVQYDNNGYVVAYRASVSLRINKDSKGIKKNYTASGTYDFAVDANTVLSDQQRFDAIKYSSQKAIAAFVAQLSAQGTRKEN